MPYSIPATEYSTFRGVPLDTAAWRTTDLSVFWAGPAEYRGNDIVVPYAQGVRPGRRTIPERRIVVPMVVTGDLDADGVAHATTREGLRANLDALALVFRPGSGTLDVLMPDGSTRRATAHVLTGLQTVPAGAGALRAVVELLIPEGVFRSTVATTATSASVSAGGTGAVNVSNPGTAEQNATTYTMSGTATKVLLTNLTHPETPTLEVTANLATGNVVIDTAAYSVTQGVSSLFATATGTPGWLPLVPGTNQIRIQPTGGTATLAISHLPAYL
jgi:hypothetical protein